jgi:CRP/FNR family cyclic AMP-dependent transcriptional regulator
LKRARAILAGAKRRSIGAGEILIDEGVPNQYLHLVLSGHLQVVGPANDIGLRPVYLADREAGAVTGEYSAFDHRNASARVSAVEPTDLLSMRGVDFTAALAQDPEAAKHIYRNLLELLIERLRGNDAEADLVPLV